MLFVARTEQPRDADVRSDDYIPLSVNWVRVGSVRPIYYRIQSDDGGDIELKIEPLRGELVGATVIGNPMRRVQVPQTIYMPPLVTEGSVFVNLKLWNPNPDNVPTKQVIYEKDALGWGEDEVYLYYAFSDATPNRFVFAGDAGFGISDSDMLSALISKKSSASVPG
jgi:hypothetical protein